MKKQMLPEQQMEQQILPEQQMLLRAEDTSGAEAAGTGTSAAADFASTG